MSLAHTLHSLGREEVTGGIDMAKGASERAKEAAISPDALLAITGSKVPYLYDVPHLLSLPDMFECRFRYRHKWLSPEVLETLKREPDHYEGKDLVLAFHSVKTGNVYPLRRATIITLESRGPLVFLRFRVGAFPRVAPASPQSVDPEPAVGAAMTLRDAGLQLLGHGVGHEVVAPGRDILDHQYVRTVKNITAVQWMVQADTRPEFHWALLTRLLMDEEVLKGVPFFHVLGFKDESGDTVRTSVIENSFSPTKEKIYGYSLLEGERYRLRVLEWFEPPVDSCVPAFRVRCQVNPGGLALEGASDLVVGRYDILEFTYLASTPVYLEMAIAASLEDSPKTSVPDSNIPVWRWMRQGHVDAPSSGLQSWPALFSVRAPVRIKARKIALLLSLVLALGGVFLYLWVAPTKQAPQRVTLELVALGCLLPIYAQVTAWLDGLFKLRRGMEKLKGGLAGWGEKE